MPAANYRGKNVVMKWGAGFANTLNLGYLFDDAKTYPGQREGFETKQYKSGVEDAWDNGTDQYLTGVLRYIPREDGTSGQGVAQTGWNGATGVNAWLTYARLKGVTRFYPDIVGAPTTFFSFYLVEPMADGVENEDDYTKRVRVVFRTIDGSPVDGY